MASLELFFLMTNGSTYGGWGVKETGVRAGITPGLPLLPSDSVFCRRTSRLRPGPTSARR